MARSHQAVVPDPVDWANRALLLVLIGLGPVAGYDRERELLQIGDMPLPSHCLAASLLREAGCERQEPFGSRLSHIQLPEVLRPLFLTHHSPIYKHLFVMSSAIPPNCGHRREPFLPARVSRFMPASHWLRRLL